MRWTEEQVRQHQERLQRAGRKRAESLTPERRAEIASIAGNARWTKYRNVPTQVDGITFPSKHEADYYLQLKARKYANDIRGFVRQVSLPLPSHKRRLIVDFVVIENDGRTRWIDAKGFETPTFKVKRDELEHHLGIRIELV